MNRGLKPIKYRKKHVEMLPIVHFAIDLNFKTMDYSRQGMDIAPLVLSRTRP